MSQKQLIENFAAHTGITNKSAASILQAVGEVASFMLANGDKVTIPGLGALVGKYRKPRSVTAPLTGIKHAVPAHISVVFRAKQSLKNSINGKDSA